MDRVQKGRKHAKQHDDEDDNQRDAFVREHGGYSCSHYVGNRRVDALNHVVGERMFILARSICATGRKKMDNLSRLNQLFFQHNGVVSMNIEMLDFKYQLTLTSFYSFTFSEPVCIALERPCV